VITSRRTQLVRVPDLQGFRHAIVELGRQPDRWSSRVVLVPTAGAARQLARTLGEHERPQLATREEFYDRLHACLDDPPPRLTAYDRIAMLQAAAREARVEATADSRKLRPGLIAEMLRFYDTLRRQNFNIGRFEELLVEALSRDAEHDRGAERMLAQARWLAAAFRGYERRVRQSSGCDEHVLRELLAGRPSPAPVHEVIVTVSDWIAEPNGLYVADFDLLTRLPGLEAIHVLATEGLLASGFHQRIHEWLPGIEETSRDGRAVRPVLVAPDPDRLVFVHRDREEELVAIATRLTARAEGPAPAARTAVVFKRPLPYLYLARDVLGSADIRYEASDALPLATEPPAAALDLVLEFVESGFTRASIVALLGSPHFVFEHSGRRVDREAIAALDEALSRSRYLGTIERLMDCELGADVREDTGVWSALRAARDAAASLAPLLEAAPVSTQLRFLTTFFDTHEAPTDSPRLQRGRAAIRSVLDALAAAHAAHDDAAMDVTEVAGAVRRWIEEHTFAAEPGPGGLQLVDDQAARYGEFDEMALVGLIEGEWPDRPKRNIFYPASLLISLGWPSERDRRSAAEARFVELLQSAGRRVTVSTVTLDEEMLVEPSTFVDEIPRARLAVAPPEAPEVPSARDAGPRLRTFDEEAETWLAMRAGRSPHASEAYHGQTGPLPERRWTVSALETYLGCPFRFFARHVLDLEEEAEDEEVLDPRTQGMLVHDVFEGFFARWQDDGHRAITLESLDTARDVFREVVEASLARWNLSAPEAAVERTRLLGSPAAGGLGEAVFRMEVERPVPVVDRLIEFRLEGEFVFETTAGPRVLPLRGKADRIDLLADGTFRLIDYKLGWPPNRARALQLPIYALCAEQRLRGHLGRHWTLGEAAYVAFKGPRRVVGLFASDEDRSRVMAEAQQRLVDTVDAIAAGRFPPAPDDVFRCETCAYGLVCRKDYVGEL
jgi:RecB family exonuclease